MSKTILLLLSILLGVTLSAQVTFVIDSLPDYTPEEDVIYIAGTLNGWNPGDPAFALQKNEDDKWSFTTDLFDEGATIEFKFTRGNWETVEKGPMGEEIANRSFTFGNGETESIIIYNWADAAPPDSTAAWNVSIMDEAFYMPQLDRTRRIWIYLPPDYHESNSNYPVLYMHDGQNLFEVLTSYAGEWEVDETLNALADSGYLVPIVIGIDNGGEYRLEELTPWAHPTYGGGRGDDYLAFIVETLKPYVDDNYRTLTDRDNTAIMGSSLGGLISTYGAMKYQEVFSKSGPFSPAYWINNDSIWEYIHETGKESNIRFYQNVGGEEGDEYIDMMYQMEDSLKSIGFEDVTSKVIPDGQHNEATWRDDFKSAYLWLFQSFATNVKSYLPVEVLEVNPNPVKKNLTIKNLQINKATSIDVFDMNGHKVVSKTVDSNTINVSALPAGYYSMRISQDQKRYLVKFIKL